MVLNNNYQLLGSVFMWDSGYGNCFQYLDGKLTYRTPEQLAQDQVNNGHYVDLRQRISGGSWYSTQNYSDIYYDNPIVYIASQISNSYTRTKTIWVPHNEDGTAEDIDVYSKFKNLWSDNIYITVNGTFDLPVIPRGSDISVPSQINLSPGTVPATVTSYLEDVYLELSIKIGSTVIRDFTDVIPNILDQIDIGLVQSELEGIYQLIPNDTGVVLTYILKTYTSSAKTTLLGTKEKTVLANASAWAKPTFSAFTISDDNISTVALGSWVKNQSHFKVTIIEANKAVAKYGASILYYGVQINNELPYLFEYASVGDVAFTLPAELLTSGTINIIAMDSRLIQTKIASNITLLDYTTPEIVYTELPRLGGSGEVVHLINNIRIYPTVFANGTNKITYFGYRVKTSSEEWDSQTWHEVTLSYLDAAIQLLADGYLYIHIEESAGFRIYSNGVDEDFTIGQKYDTQFKIKDGITDIIFNEDVISSPVQDGSLAMPYFKDENAVYHFGFNTLPSEDYNYLFKGPMAQTDDGINFHDIPNLGPTIEEWSE